MGSRASTGNTRDRLLLAAAELLASSDDRALSTRAVCERAGVQAPTLYHHFGSKQGLVDAVIGHGFTQYVRPSPASGDTGDPVDAIRQGWDRHVQFGLDHPTFYALLYGQVELGKPCTITAPAHAILRDLLVAAAREGLLKVPADDAAEQILAANIGATLSLITQPDDQRDMNLSDRVREAALAGVLRNSPEADQPAMTRACTALTLRTLLDQDSAGLSAGEQALLNELLDRLAAS
ncbi:TetR/AcrR family transcriptional regulator [Micromonospora sp. NPDC005173]|uniref:TetR/AcrR family transcriptional regulator n=1 Tax=Micromonospora sp. NPDC005173 TaxID=3157165 RepID=UPI0033ACF703